MARTIVMAVLAGAALTAFTATVPPASAEDADAPFVEYRVPASPPASSLRGQHEALCVAVYDLGADGDVSNVCVRCSATGSRRAFERAIKQHLERNWRLEPQRDDNGAPIAVSGLEREFQYGFDNGGLLALERPDVTACEAGR